MKLLFAIPHYFNPEGDGKHVSLCPDPAPRIQALDACLRALMGNFGGAQCTLNLDHRHTEQVRGGQAHQVDILLCTTNNQHVLNALSVPAHWYQEHPTTSEPLMLPFVCHELLRERLGQYDYYGYMEDDLILQDPWFFTKLEWFNQQTELLDLLQPNRFELGEVAPYTKAYIDGDIGPRAAGRFQNPAERPSLQARALGQPLLFKRPLNPHAGCFFLTEAQLAHWVRQPHFGDRDCRFVSPLESAATLGIMKTFRIYKAVDPPGFLELRHFGAWFLGLVGNRIRLDANAPSAPASAPSGDPVAAAAAMEGGLKRLEAEDLGGAEAGLREAIRLQPGLAAAHLNLGVVLKRQGRREEAAAAYRRAAELQPGMAAAHSNLGLLLCELGQLTEAEAACRRALALDDGFRNAHVNLGQILASRGAHEEALESYHRALALGASAHLYNNMVVSYYELGQLSEADAASARALALDPNFAEAHANLAAVRVAQGRPAEAIAAQERVAALKPELALAASNLLLYHHYDADMSAAALFQAHRDWGQRHGRVASPFRFNPAVDHRARAAGRRIRVGYVSADLRGHSVAFFFAPLLAHHNRERFEVFCYADVAHADFFTNKLRPLAEHWRDIVGKPHEEVARRIHADGIDILVDLGGHTAKNRLGVFALKPAPVQVTWLGYPDTTGLPQMDYRLTDAIADPEGSAEAFCSERLIRLPQGFLCYQPAPNAPEVGPLPAARNGYVTFGSFNNLSKVSPPTVALWSRLLRALPNARLLLKAKALADAEVRLRILTAFARERVDPARIELLGHAKTLKRHLAVYDRLDIALDTWPYNGTTTTCEGLWMGVPTITLTGDRHAARVGASLLERLELTRLVAATESDFIDRALALARDPTALAELRQGLRERMRASPLMDGKGFARSIEAAFDRMLSAVDSEPGGRADAATPSSSAA